jgi:hypothetical protein
VWLLLIAVLASEPTAYVWAPEQRDIVEDWFRAVGERKANETLGELAVRAGKLRLGTPYLDAPQIDAPEELNIKLDTLQCQSFVESSLAIARCVTEGTANAECFAREIQQFRYRDGLVNGFASRLHYFNDWLADNARRGSIVMLEAKDTAKWTGDLNYMTKHSKRYPALAHAEVLAAISADEARINAADNRYVPKEDVATIEKQLKTGDVIAFVSSQKPGLMISHTGFVVRDTGGVMKIMHASSYHGKVIITRTDLAGYVNARPDRLGIMVARPQSPVTTQATASAGAH